MSDKSMDRYLPNKIPGFIKPSLYFGKNITYYASTNNTSSIKLIPARFGPCCQDCSGPGSSCDSCQQCYVDYVYTGLEDPSYCYNGFECKSCQKCERTCQPCPF